MRYCSFQGDGQKTSWDFTNTLNPGFHSTVDELVGDQLSLAIMVNLEAHGKIDRDWEQQSSIMWVNFESGKRCLCIEMTMVYPSLL